MGKSKKENEKKGETKDLVKKRFVVQEVDDIL